ncbi:hypothetical protein FJTKL_02597 [Diaporthe vaccinii]|uniref:Uncharacterized protein n=1 Tax=Diaporthe vaccinii TaxID=105482 RepID=A0ABR4DXV4_9PEZI
MGQVAPSLDQLRQHLEQSSVPSVFPDAPEFKKLAQSYNRAFSYRPAAISSAFRENVFRFWKRFLPDGLNLNIILI